MRTKNLVILISGIVIGVVVMPVVALISFGIVTTVANQISGGDSPLSTLTNTPCVGMDKSRSYAFTGFVDTNDENRCALLDSKGNLLYEDTNYKKLNPTPTKTVNSSLKDGEVNGTFNVQDAVVLFFRILLYCSVCLTPLLPVLAVVWFVRQNSKGKDQVVKTKK